MKEIPCLEYNYNLIAENPANNNTPVFPYFRDENGNHTMTNISPHHGRSYIVGRNENGRYVVSKGNGLSYTAYQLVNTGEFGDDTLGLLLRKDAMRDFNLGIEIENLGIKTNKMEYVIELEHNLTLTTGHILRPILLQYDVECPYRICDAPYMKQKQITEEVLKWERINEKQYDERYLVAAYVLIRNLKIMHDNGVLQNAIHFQNYTWALELLDFELSSSPQYPYDDEDARRHAQSLFHREIFQTYEVINHIAGCLNETVDDRRVEEIFNEFGFDFRRYVIS